MGVSGTPVDLLHLKDARIPTRRLTDIDVKVKTPAQFKHCWCEWVGAAFCAFGRSHAPQFTALEDTVQPCFPESRLRLRKMQGRNIYLVGDSGWHPPIGEEGKLETGL